MQTSVERVYQYNEDAYQASGLDAQRRYPNEELCRFMGRNYFSVPRSERKSIRVLEIGSGSAANLWMIAKEGFDAYGIDLAPSAIDLAHQMLKYQGQTAHLKTGSMTELPYEDVFFDCVVDIFSTYCLDQKGYDRTLAQVSRVLKPGGKFFTYAPGKNSDAWKNHAPAEKLDGSTLNGIYRENSPYSPSPYPFRFTSIEQVKSEALRNNLNVTNVETVGRTYRSGQEYFEFIVAEASKISSKSACFASAGN